MLYFTLPIHCCYICSHLENIFTLFIFCMCALDSETWNTVVRTLSVISDEKTFFHFKLYLLIISHDPEHTTFTMALPSGTHCAADSTEAMHIKGFAQGHKILTFRRILPNLIERTTFFLLPTNVFMEIK